MSVYIQYIGDNQNGDKVFVDVSTRWLKVEEDGEYELLSDQLLQPISASAYQTMLNDMFSSGVFVANQYGSAYILFENGRDGHTYHLCGLKAIQKLLVGQIIPLSGFTNKGVMSEDDKLLLTGQISLFKFIKKFSRQRLYFSV